MVLSGSYSGSYSGRENSLENSLENSGRVGDRVQKYLPVWWLLSVYRIARAERAFLGVLLCRYKLIFLTQNNAF